jgi:hypothetical protein
MSKTVKVTQKIINTSKKKKVYLRSLGELSCKKKVDHT